MKKFEIGETVYADVTTHAARKCVVIARKRFTYLLKTLDRLHDNDDLLIKRPVTELWKIPKPELLERESAASRTSQVPTTDKIKDAK